MDLAPIMESLAKSYPVVLAILAVLGTLVVAGQGVVLLTPTKKDDEAVEKIFATPVIGPFLAAIAKFGVFQKK